MTKFWSKPRKEIMSKRFWYHKLKKEVLYTSLSKIKMKHRSTLPANLKAMQKLSTLAKNQTNSNWDDAGVFFKQKTITIVIIDKKKIMLRKMIPFSNFVNKCHENWKSILLKIVYHLQNSPDLPWSKHDQKSSSQVLFFLRKKIMHF